MYIFAYAFLPLALLLALGGAATGLAQLWQGKASDLGWVEKASLGVALCLLVASCYLLYALVACDFSLDYVASYTDRTLPLFYRITAFWAGHAGSLLFWALMVALCGAAFQFSDAYKSLSLTTRLWFWVFFLAIMAFFGLLLSAWSNPFMLRMPIPADGRGLNPLLQNPGMIIHPPLLFLGYGGFVIPGCLALAQSMRRAQGVFNAPAGSESSGPEPSWPEPSWMDVARPFTLTAWLFLTVGIVLGGWWAYMELGWGGYWAWDPVENASLLPWLLGTAALHVGLIESRRGKLPRVNVFLMALTTVSAFFATYLVRGNVIQSVHAFGEGGVGPALLIFTLAFLAVVVLVAAQGRVGGAEGLDGLETREGFLVMTSWLLIALALLILVATLWPLISALWGTSAGLNAGFYNSVCLPLFAVILALLAVCPWLKWGGGVRDWRKFGAVIAVFAVSLGVFWKFGMHEAMPLMGAALCVAALVSMALTLTRPEARRHMPSLAACLVHVGLILTALGVTFSGPYQQTVETALAKGESVDVGPYTARLNELYEGRDALSTYTFVEAEIVLSKGGREVGMVAPQRRVYAKFSGSAFSEAETRPSLGSEFYATLLGIDGQQRAVVHFSANPLVNWLWIGGALMTLAPLLALFGGKRRRENGAGGGI